jgi:hypothetical protein
MWSAVVIAAVFEFLVSLAYKKVLFQCEYMNRLLGECVWHAGSTECV